MFLIKEVYMKKVKFWRMEIKQLSLTERMIFTTAMNKLLSWEVFKEEFLELDIIRRLLESEIQVNTPEVKVVKNNLLAKGKKGETPYMRSA
jgi:hypothetical protein